jgi:hypothetical protein
VFGIGEPLQRGPHLGKNDLGCFPAHPWDGIEAVDRLLFFL